MKIMQLLDSLWDKVSDWFENIGEEILDFMKPVALEISKNGGLVLLEAAAAAVNAAEEPGVSGEEKAKRAFNQVVAVLETKGLPVVTNAIKAAIEAAVARMKNPG